MKVDQPERFPLNSAVKIRVKSHGRSISLIHSEIHIDMEGKVVHHKSNGLGIQIESMSHEMRQSWIGLLEQAMSGKNASAVRIL
jgi:hypothetical protein